MDCTMRMPRKPWDLPFLAESEEVGALRRILRTRLGLWGLHESIEAAQLCVSELVANVINHVGPGTPTTLVVSMNGTHLRIEVHDPTRERSPCSSRRPSTPRADGAWLSSMRSPSDGESKSILNGR